MRVNVKFSRRDMGEIKNTMAELLKLLLIYQKNRSNGQMKKNTKKLQSELRTLFIFQIVLDLWMVHYCHWHLHLHPTM